MLPESNILAGCHDGAISIIFLTNVRIHVCERKLWKISQRFTHLMFGYISCGLEIFDLFPFTGLFSMVSNIHITTYSCGWIWVAFRHNKKGRYIHKCRYSINCILLAKSENFILYSIYWSGKIYLQYIFSDCVSLDFVWQISCKLTVAILSKSRYVEALQSEKSIPVHEDKLSIITGARWFSYTYMQ